MRNYIHIIRNLPGILKRLESEIQGKASASSVSALCADMNSLNRRLADRPTKADLTIVEGDLGARIEKLEAAFANTGPTGEDLRTKLVGMVEAARQRSIANDLNAEKTGGPNLKDVLAQVKAEKAAGEVKAGKKTPNAARKALGLDPMATGNVPVTKSPKLSRKPKGGGK